MASSKTGRVRGGGPRAARAEVKPVAVPAPAVEPTGLIRKTWSTVLRVEVPRLPALLAVGLGLGSLIPYIVLTVGHPPGRAFLGFIFQGDDAFTYLAKMREGAEGGWLWLNRYTTEPSPGAYYFTFWLAVGHVAALLHLPMLVMFHVIQVLGGILLVLAAWLFLRHFVADEPTRRFGLVFLCLGMGLGWVQQIIWLAFGSRIDALDLRMPELSIFYSVLATPHFAWAAALEGIAIVLTLRAIERESLRLGLAAGAVWVAEVSIHAQMVVLVGGAILVAMIYRRPGLRGWLAAAIAMVLPAPYVLYSYWASLHVPEIMRWSAEWRNNLPPDAVGLLFALAPQLSLAALAMPLVFRRRSREDVFLLAWLLLLAVILWLPNPAANLRRRFFDGIYLPLGVLAAMGMVQVLVPRLRSERARHLLPFSWVAVSAVASAFLFLGPMVLGLVTPGGLDTVPQGYFAGLQWLGEHPDGVVLSTANTGLMVPAYTSDTVYVGQYSETLDANRKQEVALQVLAGRRSLADFEASEGVRVRYVFWTDDVKAGAPAGLGAPVFTAPGAAIYRLY